MKALCWHGTEDIRVDSVPDPKIIDARDAIVKITATAICGSDLHFYGGYVLTTEEGDILSHEPMGEVIKVGRDVKKLNVGDRVVVPFTIDCSTCYFARRVCSHGATRRTRTRTLFVRLWASRQRVCSAIPICWAGSPGERQSSSECRLLMSACLRSLLSYRMSRSYSSPPF